MHADKPTSARLGFDPASYLPTDDHSGPRSESTADSWLEASAAKHLGRSKSGRELLRFVRESGTPVEIVTPREFEKRFGRVADGMYSRGVIYLNKETAADAMQGALTLAHEATHALDASRGPRSHAQTERLALARERQVARELGADESARADIVHDVDDHAGYRASLGERPTSTAVYDLSAAQSEGTAEGRAVVLAAGRASGNPTRAMRQEARKLGFSDEQIGALHTALKHRSHRQMFLTRQGADLLQDAGFSREQVARVRRAIALANHAAIGDDPRFRVGGS